MLLSWTSTVREFTNWKITFKLALQVWKAMRVFRRLLSFRALNRKDQVLLTVR